MVERDDGLQTELAAYPTMARYRSRSAGDQAPQAGSVRAHSMLNR